LIRGPRFFALCAGSAALGVALATPARAQVGPNHVQYQPRQFKIIETTHFDVFFYEEEREAALDAARMAERIYGRLSRLLDHDFQDRKPIILYASQSDFQQTNVLGGHIDESTGGVTESLKDRVLLPLTGSYAEFEHVLGHELVHSFQFDILKRNAVQATASPFAFVPSLWFMEGMAEYLSVGEIDAKTVAWLTDASLSGYLRTIDQMERFNDFLSYRFGQSLWNYIGTKWGDETIGLLLKRTAAMGPDRAFERTLGVTLRELSREWHDAVRAAYLPRISSADEVRKMASRVTTHSFPTGRGKSPTFIAPALSPDGSELVYLSDQGHDLYSFFDMYLADAETGEAKRTLVKSARSGSFESLRYLTSSSSWAPDGERLAFVAKSSGRDAIHVINVRTGRIEMKWTPDLNGVQSPYWSPDGTRVVFTGLLGGVSDLYIWDTRTDYMEQLTADRYAQLHPSWSPDGRTIAFASDRTPETNLDQLVFGPLRITLLDLETREQSLVAGQEGGLSINPSWSPDGRTIAYLSTREGLFDVYLHELDTGETLRLTRAMTGVMGEGALLTSPGMSWARNADRIAFSYFEEAGFNIYTIDQPRAYAQPAGPPAVPSTAASQVGRERVVESVPLDDDVSVSEPGEPRSFYLTDEGFRRSDYGEDPAALAALRDPGRLSVQALLDSATLSLPDTATLAYRDYDVSLSPDIVGRPTIGAQAGGFYGGGIYGGSFITLSDMLGNHNMVIAGDIQGSFSNLRLMTQYTYLRNRVNFGVTAQQIPFYRYRGRAFGEVPGRPGLIGEYDLFQRDQFRSVGILTQYPFSAFSRVDFTIEASSIETDLELRGRELDSNESFSFTIDGRTRAFVKPTVGYLFDNSLGGFTGAIGGRRLQVSVSSSMGDLNLADMIADVRHYSPLPGSLVFAQRFLSFTRISTSSSNDAREFELAWGGPYYLRGYDVGSYGALECELSKAETELDFFCPAQEQLIGSSVLLLNSEVRFPVLNGFKDAWLPMNFPPIDAAVFFDVGVAWTPGFSSLTWSRDAGQDIVLYREPLASYGVGVRANLFFAILRVDYSMAPGRGSRFGRGIWSVSLGPIF
jgi:Tol biopolymer transport system component